jgi:DNA-directed RNA polymerase subunit L/DNA-directed RNA polymerase alpha subunit
MSTPVFSKLQRIDNRTISFTLSPTKYQYANTLRRAIQSEVPCLGFRADMKDDGATTDVKIYKNSTPMSNEMLADRIGLLPIAMPKGVVNEWDKDSVLFHLHVKNETDEFRYVTASDFECLLLKEGAEERVKVPNTDFFHPDPVTAETCLIAVLKPLVEGQPPEEVHLDAFASLGIGREHTRFNPTSQCSYGNTLDTDEKRVNAFWIEWLREHKKVDPKDLEKDTSRKQRLENEFRSLEIQRCFLVDAEGEPYSFNFTVESVGSMNVYMIVARSLQSMIALCEKYQGLDSGDLPDNIEIRPTDKTMKGFDIFFQGEDHTLGNMLQIWITDNKVEQDENLTFVGYCIPHPLRDEMKMSMGVKDGKVEFVRKTLAEAAKGCGEMFAKWFVQFTSMTAGETEILMRENGGEKTVWDAHRESKMSIQKKK